MITLAWYLLKVIICSGILFGYYYIALRNKAFHRWNRFYLLAAIIISLIIPELKINIFSNGEQEGTVVQMLQTISYGDEAVIEYGRNNSFQFTDENVTEITYLLICAVFLFIFLLSLIKINRLKKKYPVTQFDDISFINTSAKGTPFSFFKSIFWNKAIELNSEAGQQIFNHEIAHIKEKHSYDKIFMNIVLIFFWINPFFWLIRKELFMIHEFIADKDALEGFDINSFAKMILLTVYPGQNFSLTNNFFYSPIKRRLLMINKHKNPKVNYISRLLVLPLASIVFFAFTLKVKNNSANLYHGKSLTVIIDAAHGGTDNGAVSPNGIKEKDITLDIAKKVAELNSNPRIEILLSRKDDIPLSVKDRVEFAKNNHADVFISIHVNAAADNQLSGLSVLIDKKNSSKDLLLGSALIDELKKSYPTANQIGARNKGIWVLDENVCPSAIVESGYLSNANDEAFITNQEDQQKIAENILNAIADYASSVNRIKQASPVPENTLKADKKDSVPDAIFYKNRKVESINGMKDSSKIRLAFTDGSQIIITKEEAQKSGLRLPPPAPVSIPKNVLFVIDGKISSNKILGDIDASDIQSLTVLKGESAIKKYGERGKNGAIEITTKIHAQNNAVRGADKVFTKVENEASFPGGQSAWVKYISKAIRDSIGKFTEADYGTCVLRFIVNANGEVSEVVATTMNGTELAKVAINAIEKGPKWIPATQNGYTVACYRLQPVTWTNSGKSLLSGQNKTTQ